MTNTSKCAFTTAAGCKRDHVQLAHNHVEKHLLVVDAEVLRQLLVDLREVTGAGAAGVRIPTARSSALSLPQRFLSTSSVLPQLSLSTL